MGSSNSESRLCGALTRSGGTCHAFAMRNASNGRCWWHGGKSSVEEKSTASQRTPRRSKTASDGTNAKPARDQQRAPYSRAVLPGEAALFAALPVGTVDDELRLYRLRLDRAAAAEAKLIGGGETDGLTRVQDEINRITMRIDRLENRRAQLLKLATVAAAAGLAADDKGDDPHALARAIRAALDEIEAVTAPNGNGSDSDADA